MTTRASVTINSQHDRQKVCDWAMKTGEGTVVTFRKKSRSTEQSAKMWAMLHEVSEQVVWHGAKLDPEDWKDVFTASLRHARVVPGIDKGTFVPLGMRTSTMTIEEMSNLIELVYAFGSEHDVKFKEPREDTNSDARPSASEEPVGHIRSTEEAGGGQPQNQPPASAMSKDLRHHLIDFARKGFSTLSDGKLDEALKSDALEAMRDSYKEMIGADDWPKFDSILTVFKAVYAGKRTVEQGRNYVAVDLLDCSVDELKQRERV